MLRSVNKKRYPSERQVQYKGAAMALAALGFMVFYVMVSASAAKAQQPYPPRPVAPIPYPGGQQQPAYQPSPYPGGRGGRPSPHELRCIQLEQELANDWTRNQQGNNQLPKIRKEIQKYDRIYQTTQAKAERSGCYESLFIFGRQLKRTPRCMRMHRTIEDSRRRLAQLQEQSRALSRPGSSRRRQSELISALARAGCGAQYQQESRRRGGGGGGWFTSLFEDESYRSRRELETSRIVPFGTYRTLCVRTCDGYYFPVSYSALPSRFGTDINQCRNQCAAPAELFVYRNPGEEAEQMVSADGRQAYSNLPNAWRYRREYVKGCSCKSTEYDPAAIAEAEQKKADEEAAKANPGPPDNRIAQDPKKVPKQQ